MPTGMSAPSEQAHALSVSGRQDPTVCAYSRLSGGWLTEQMN